MPKDKGPGRKKHIIHPGSDDHPNPWEIADAVYSSMVTRTIDAVHDILEVLIPKYQPVIGLAAAEVARRLALETLGDLAPPKGTMDRLATTVMAQIAEAAEKIDALDNKSHPAKPDA